MLEYLQEIVNKPAFGLVCGLIGFLIGNRLAIGRDKRLEYNNLIDPIRLNLLSIKGHPGSNISGPTMISLVLIREKLPFWKRRGFDLAVENFIKSRSELNITKDKLGGFSYTDKTLIFRSVNNLLKYVKPK